MLPEERSALVVMEAAPHLSIYPAAHPRMDVHRAGFPLDHDYLEQCWTPVLGPSSVLLLRRVSYLWREVTPAELTTSDLGAQLGLSRGTGRNSPANRTLDRIVRFGFADWSGPSTLDVFTEVPPVPTKQLARLPSWCAQRHEQLLSTHLADLAQEPPGLSPATSGAAIPDATRMSGRLNDLADASMTTVGLHR